MPDESEVTSQEETSQPVDDFDKERAMETIRKLRDEVKSLKPSAKKLMEFEQAEETRRKAEMTEADRLKAEVDQARKEAEQARADMKTTLIRAAFVAEAAKAGASYPEDVYRLADTSGIEVDENGRATGVAEAVKSLVDAGRVPLTGRQIAPKLDGGAGGGDRSGPQVKLTADDLEIARKMNIAPEKFAANKAALAKRQE